MTFVAAQIIWANTYEPRESHKYWLPPYSLSTTYMFKKACTYYVPTYEEVFDLLIILEGRATVCKLPKVNYNEE